MRHRRWLAGQCLRPRRGAVLALRSSPPLWWSCLSGSRATPALPLKIITSPSGDQKSKISFVYEQYGSLAHSLLNGRLDLMVTRWKSCWRWITPTIPPARRSGPGQQPVGPCPIITVAIMSISASRARLLFQLPSRLSPASKTWAYPPCMIVMGPLFLAGKVSARCIRWRAAGSARHPQPRICSAWWPSSAQPAYYLFVRPLHFMNTPSSAAPRFR